MDFMAEIREAVNQISPPTHKREGDIPCLKLLAWAEKEILRARRVEDYSVKLDQIIAEFGIEDPAAIQEMYEMFSDVIEANPRPRNDG